MLLNRNRMLVLLAAGALVPSVVYGQQSTGSLSGRVTNADGVTPKAGVKVTVVEKTNNLTRVAVSDAEGNWHIPALPVGDYKIILAAGSQSQVLNRQVNLGMDQSIRYRWPAEATATVEVIATAAGVDQINTTSAEVGVNVDSSVLSEMPIMDRNVNSAAVLAPGVQIIQGSQVDPTKKTSTYIVSGDGQGRGTNFNVDGADNNSSDVGGYVMPVPFDAIDQFQVVTNQYKAEFGRSNAGFLNVVTKSGGNDVVGVANFQWTDQNMRARNTDESPKLANDSKVYSVMTSGPIIKDKLFYMVAGEKTASSVGETMDSRAIAVIPALASESNVLSKMNLYTKLDWNINQMWLASFKYARYYDTSANQTFPQAAAVANYVDPSMLGTNRDSTTSYGAKLTGTFGNIVWESTINHFNYINSIRPSTPGEGLGSGIEVRPRFVANSATDTWYRGQDPNSYQNTGVERSQWKNEVSWTLPEHNLKGGLDVQKTDYPFEQYFWAHPGLYVVGLDGSAATGVSFANAFSPAVTEAQVSRAYLTVPIENPPTSFKGYGLYLQDDWTVNSHWNVYYGYRIDWDTQLDYYSQFDTMYAQIHAANPLLAGIGDQAPRTHKYGSPRIQALYKPFGDDSLTFKFGAGKFVASTIDNVVGFSRALNAPVNGMPVGYVYNTDNSHYAGQGPSTTFTSGSLLTTVNGTAIYLPVDLTPYNYVNNVNGLQTLFTNQVAGLLSKANFNTGGKELLPSDFAYPTTQTLSFGMTYKFSERSAIDLTLLYSHTKNLTLQYATDGSAPQVWSPNPGYAGTPWSAAGATNPLYPTYDQGDSIFLSNQTSTSRQLQVKYTYTTSNFSALATFVCKNVTSSNGGDGGAFTNGGNADFYGSGVNQVWSTGAERNAQGTEPFSGSFSINYKWDEGTRISFLGQWHSGKYYDIFLGGQAANNATTASPDPVVGQMVGAWCLDLGFRASQTIKIGPKFQVEPYVQIQNLLNNYDYGTNYQNLALNPDESVNGQLGQRLGNFQTNSPRTFAVGVRLSF